MAAPSNDASLDEMVSLRDAFTIMQRFLDAHWQRAGRPSDSMSDLLSFASLLQDGGTADPAVLRDWLRAAKSVIDREVGPIMLDLKPPQQ